MKRKIKISVFLNEINNILTPLIGERVCMSNISVIKNHKHFHAEVGKILYDYLQKNKLFYGSWNITLLKTEFGVCENDDIFKLELPNFIQNKTVKWTRAGKISDIVFVPSYGFVGVDDMTFEEYLLRINKNNIEKAMDDVRKNIQECEKTLAEEHKRLRKLQDEFLKTKKQLKEK